MKNLREYPWKISYTSNTHNTITDFYIPALECAIQYDRKAGFFSSAILSKVARGLGAMLHNKGRMRLIMGCQFSPQDLQAIQQGYELRDALLSRLDADLKPPESFAQLKHLEILSWLIQNQYLDIKIAIPLKENGLPEDSTQQLDPQHIDNFNYVCIRLIGQIYSVTTGMKYCVLSLKTLQGKAFVLKTFLSVIKLDCYM